MGEVITTGMERARQVSATSSASVATTTGSIKPLACAARHTHSTMGRPAIGRSTLRDMRVEWSRAGMTAAMRRELMQTSVHNGEACGLWSWAASLRGQRSQGAFGAGQSFGRGAGRVALMLRVDEFDLGEAEDAEDRAQVRLLMIE